ncbi:MAG: hypothetical protein Q7S56_01725 [Nanoarchaeota archaeon]|nr:hypothetical protein [Nanoarchaeota archaeon]
MTEGFLWKKVSEPEKEQIKKESKKIMDSFSSKLEKLGLDRVEEPMIERGNGERKEGSAEKVPIDREIMFSNAPNKNKDFIIAEKKGW